MIIGHNQTITGLKPNAVFTVNWHFKDKLEIYREKLKIQREKINK